MTVLGVATTDYKGSTKRRQNLQFARIIIFISTSFHAQGLKSSCFDRAHHQIPYCTMNTELLSTVLALATAYLLFKVYSVSSQEQSSIIPLLKVPRSSPTPSTPFQGHGTPNSPNFRGLWPPSPTTRSSTTTNCTSGTGRTYASGHGPSSSRTLTHSRPYTGSAVTFSRPTITITLGPPRPGSRRTACSR